MAGNGQRRLQDKVVIVTGAAQGIGAAIAKSAAHEGARVVLADIDIREGVATAGSIAAAGGLAEFRALDVSDCAAFDALIQTVCAGHGRIDALVNNAAISVKYPAHEMPDAEWDRCFDVNLKGAWNGCTAVLRPMMEQRAGAIVNIGSVHGHRIIPKSFPYPVTKHALVGLTRALGVEYAGYNIRVNAISPGYIDTRMNWEWWDSQLDPKAARAASEALIPARRIGRPEEVAATAVFLMSDEASYITAADIPIDGGRLALYHE